MKFVEKKSKAAGAALEWVRWVRPNPSIFRRGFSNPSIFEKGLKKIQQVCFNLAKMVKEEPI